MNKDQVKGRVEEAKGKVKEVTGKVIGNKKLEEKGKVEEIAGKARANYGNVKHDLKRVANFAAQPWRISACSLVHAAPIRSLLPLPAVQLNIEEPR